MNRPLERLGIQELEACARVRDVSDAQLGVLESELLHRSSSRAEALLNDVRDARKFKQTAVQIRAKAAERRSVQAELPGLAATVAPVATPTPALTVPRQSTFPRPLSQPATTARVANIPSTQMTEEQAYRYLKVQPSAGWEQVELARREVVARAQPDRLEGLAPEKRKLLQDEGRLANAAYKSLLQK